MTSTCSNDSLSSLITWLTKPQPTPTPTPIVPRKSNPLTAQHFRRGNAGSFINLQFTVQGIAAAGVGSGHDLDAAIVKLLEHALHLRVGGAILPVGLGLGVGGGKRDPPGHNGA